MASRLALNLTKGLSKPSKFAAPALKRGFATPVAKKSNNGVKTESTTLSNGLTVRAQRFYILTGSQLTDGDADCHRALAMGADLDCWCLD